MKNVTKLFAAAAVAAVALFFTTNVQAQGTPRLGVGLNVGVPISNGYNFVIGGDLRYQFDVDKQLSIPITAGYTHFIGEEITPGVSIPDFGYVPVKVGAKYFFDANGSGLYGLAELGAGIGVTPSGAKTGFLYSPAIGYSWSNGLDLGLKYEGNSYKGGTLDHAALRIAYGFSL